MEVTLKLTDETYQLVEQIALATGQDVTEVLADALSSSLQPFGDFAAIEQSVNKLSDDAVLALSESQMDSELGAEMSTLLDKQQRGLLEDEDHARLSYLMQIYQLSLLRKAHALREAVQRGLRDRLDS